MTAIVIILCCHVIYTPSAAAQSPGGRNFGFGLVLFEPTGLTIKDWVSSTNAFDVELGGNSYFGALRLNFDYLWEYYPFNTPYANLYVGPGISLGFGVPYYSYYYGPANSGFLYRTDGEAGLGVRMIVGMDFVPARTPLEFFVQLGPLIGLTPGFGVGIDFALGMRFYP